MHAALIKIRTSGGGRFTARTMASLLREVAHQSICHRPGQMEDRRHQIRTVWWVWYDSPAKIDSVFHGLQTGMGPGVSVLQEKGCLILWPDSGNSSLQLSQRRDVAFRVDGLCGVQENPEGSPLSYPKRQ